MGGRRLRRRSAHLDQLLGVFALIAYNASDGAPAIPRVGPSPAALSFIGIAGGASPTSQTLSIHNTGTGVLDVSAGTDRP